MGYMKWVKDLQDTGRWVALKEKYDEALKCNLSRIDFDNTNLDTKFVGSVLDFIDKTDDAHQSTKREIL